MSLKYLYAKFLKKITPSAKKNVKSEKKVYFGKGSNFIDCKIGSFTYFGNNNSIRNASIGRYCSFASFISIGGDRHPLDQLSTSPVFYSKKNVFKTYLGSEQQEMFNTSLPVLIGHDVWVGEGVFIKGGIVIGDGAVIGASSVVTHDVPPYAIVGGNPAKIIRYRFEENIIEKLEKIKWWDLPFKDIKKLTSKKISVEDFISEIEKI